MSVEFKSKKQTKTVVIDSMKNEFIGREVELQVLRRNFKKGSSSLFVFTGRRRIGKSTLVENYSQQFTYFYEFQGLHPKEAPSAELQLKHFSNRLKIYFQRPEMVFTSWLEAFAELSRFLPKSGKILIFLDEISWMGTGSKTFSAELKDAWDTLLKKHSNLVLAIAGSVSSWIQDNILNHSNFLGRVDLQMNLQELPMTTFKSFWGVRRKMVSNYDVLKVASICGGVPKYLESVDPNQSPEENISRLCFSRTGYMVYEFEKIFSDIFTRRGPIYKKIVLALIESPLTLSEVAKKLKINKSGALSSYLSDLVNSGFLSEDQVFKLDGSVMKLTKYRVKDNYLRFSLKYIQPNLKRIENDFFKFSSMDQLPGWKTILGLQFENLILNNRDLIIDKLEIPKEHIVTCSPYYQSKTTKNKGGCQIDLMITTSNFQIYVCEIKISKKIGVEVVTEMQSKLKVLKRPRHYTVHPVLIYVGELTAPVIEEDYFQLISLDDILS